MRGGPAAEAPPGRRTIDPNISPAADVRMQTFRTPTRMLALPTQSPGGHGNDVGRRPPSRSWADLRRTALPFQTGASTTLSIGRTDAVLQGDGGQCRLAAEAGR